jgi:hypothetical protein
VAEEFFEGDIVVTRVARHYAIGRILADGYTQEHVASENERAAAVALALQLAGPANRVFVYRSTVQRTLKPVEYQQIIR